MKCKNCNWPNRPGEKNCIKCGAPLVPQAESVPQVPPVRPQPVAPVNPNVCPRCSYPLRPGMTECPNCLYQISPANHRPTVAGLPEVPEGAGLHGGTVNVYTAAPAEETPTFSLTPVQKTNETEAPADLRFTGPEAILNRANTDPDNLSITSRQQASITNRDGKWVITDLSDQKTTFIHPTGGHELHDGDVILLGNRLFIFHE